MAKAPEIHNAKDVIETGMLARREIIQSGQIDSMEATKIVVALEHLAAVSSDPIRLLIASPGGSVFAGMAIYDTIRSIIARGIPVITEARGYAASMGIILLQAGSERLATPHARLLVHSVSQTVIANITPWDAEEQAQELKRLNEMLFDIIAERSGLDRATLDAKSFKRDWWLSAQEALELGLIDRIA